MVHLILYKNEEFTVCSGHCPCYSLGHRILRYQIGDIIHILLVMAVIAVVIRVIDDEKLLNKLKIKLK